MPKPKQPIHVSKSDLYSLKQCLKSKYCAMYDVATDHCMLPITMQPMCIPTMMRLEKIKFILENYADLNSYYESLEVKQNANKNSKADS